MSRKDPVQDLLQTLQALERVQGRLVVLNARIAAQAEIVADLVTLAKTAAAEAAPSGTTGPAV